MPRLPAILPIVLVTLGACGASTGLPEVGTVEVVGGDGQRGLTGVPLPDSTVLRVTDDRGRPMAGVEVTWAAEPDDRVSPSAVATDLDGTARALWTLGPEPGVDTLVARVDGHTVVYLAEAVAARAGEAWRGRNDYVEYYPGDLPLVLSAPHGGRDMPAEIADRTEGTMVRDVNTELLVLAAADALEAELGGRPHVIRALIHRRKVDLNRDIVEAAQGDPLAEQAWLEFHGFVEHARRRVEADHGRGFYVDIHGHGHEIQRIELGYLLNAGELGLSDEALDDPALAAETSIRTLAAESGMSLSALLRGGLSLGTLLEAEGFPAVPSAEQPDPGTAPYFSGGYNTARHGSLDGGPIDGVQAELNRIGVRDTAASRAAFAAALARAMATYLAEHYDFRPAPAAPSGS
ncbi:MAG: hypothetical protein ACOCVZ_05265 [Gemmatimonadota bacterium]